MDLKKIIGIIVGFLIIGLIGFFLYRWQFLLIDKSNISGDVPDALSSIQLEFNYPIDSNQKFENVFALTPGTVINEVHVDGKKVEITYNYLRTKTNYILTINKLKSLNGKSLSDKISFKTKYIEDANLNKKILEESIEDTNRDQKEYPILALLPYETEGYTVEGLLNQDAKKVEYTITLLGVYNRPEQLAEFTAQNKQYKADALAWLKSQNIDTSTAKITYLPNDPDK